MPIKFKQITTPFDISKVVDAIKHLKAGKAAGDDNYVKQAHSQATSSSVRVCYYPFLKVMTRRIICI